MLQNEIANHAISLVQRTIREPYIDTAPATILSRIWAIIVLLFSAMVWRGCCRGCPSVDVSGVYECEYSYGTERLVIQCNGRYEQFFRHTGADFSKINENTWSVSKNELGITDRRILSLKNPIIVDDWGFPKMKHMTNGYWGFAIRKKLNGDIYFAYNDDVKTSFKKIHHD